MKSSVLVNSDILNTLKEKAKTQVGITMTFC